MLTISGGDFEAVPAGVYQPCIFKALEECETKQGKAYRWKFAVEQEGPQKGAAISELSDRERNPTVRNKTGRFLAALLGKPPAAGMTVEPGDFVWRRYLVVVSPKAGATNGQTGIATFSPLA